MTKEERQKRTMEAVKKIVAEKGLDGFSIRQVAELTGINETMIYRDFYTKDQLLDVCYKEVQNEIADICGTIGPLTLNTREQAITAIKDMWTTCFQYLLEHRDNTLFMRNYRESSYRQKLLEASDNRKPKYFFDARDKFAMVLSSDIDMHCTWIYVIDFSIEFAMRILTGELPQDENSVSRIWQIMFNGLGANNLI
jgi:AcrR family transcriptional regulator